MLIKDFFLRGTTFWLLSNNEEIYAHMSRGPLGPWYFRGCAIADIGFHGNSGSSNELENVIPEDTSITKEYNIQVTFQGAHLEQSLLFKLPPEIESNVVVRLS